MKTLIGTFVTIFFAFIGLQSFANDNVGAFSKVATVEEGSVSYSIYAVQNSEKIKFSFEKGIETGITVKIYDEDFDLLYTDVLKKENAGSISYNLQQLGGGTYHVKVITKEFTKVHTFSVGEVAFENTFNPYISSVKEGGKVHVAFQKAFAPVVIKVYDINGVVFHDEVVTNKTDYHKILNLSQLEAGEYTVEVRSAGKTTTQAITL